MNTKLDKALVRDFPALFADRHAPMTHTAMCWGFPGDGWEPLIRRCAEKIEPLLHEAWAALPSSARERYSGLIPWKASQVKEKYGTLRFYMTGYPPEPYTDEVEVAIAQAEAESARTCEQCGSPDSRTRYERGWFRTSCDDCNTDHKAEE